MRQYTGQSIINGSSEPSTANIINYLFTRNAVGSADFTPTALPVANIDATYGFMLAVSAYLESGIVHLQKMSMCMKDFPDYPL